MKFKIMMLAAGAVAGSMLLFQNCSQVKTAGVGGGSDLKGSTYHGDTLSGTSTDNPNTASLKVALDKFQPLQLDASLCIMGTATKQIAEPPEAMRAPASSSETKKDCDKDDDDRKSKYKKRKYSSAPRAASVGTLQSALAQQQAALQGLIDQILHDFDTPVEIASISSGGTDLGEQPV